MNWSGALVAEALLLGMGVVDIGFGVRFWRQRDPVQSFGCFAAGAIVFVTLAYARWDS